MKLAEISATYIDHMGSDLSVVNAARASFEKESWWADAETKRLKDGDASLIRFLATGYRTSEWDDLLEEVLSVAQFYDRDKAKDQLTDILKAYKRKAQHWAPFGHPHSTIRVTMPVFLARQFVKHQVGGVWSEASRRYLSDEPEVWMPDEWHTRPGDIKQGSGSPVAHQQAINAIAAHSLYTSLKAYGDMLDLDVAPEEARTVLPLAHTTTVVWTGSLLFWSRVVNQRVDDHAQLAAQELGKKIGAIMEPLYPVSWKELTQ